MKLQTYWRDFLHLFFPEACAGCAHTLLYQEELLCTGCLFHLPRTDFHLDKDNETARQLWGKLEYRFAVSMLKLSKDSITERLIHQLKYGNKPQVGAYLGRMYAGTLQNSGLLKEIDFIVPIPLHSSKLKKRGYNQSFYFAQGLSEVLSIPCDPLNLVRVRSSVSQTQKSRVDRYDNVEDVFACTNHEKFEGKHILLVDDVLTTGATIASAGNMLIRASQCQISVATIARA